MVSDEGAVLIARSRLQRAVAGLYGRKAGPAAGTTVLNITYHAWICGMQRKRAWEHAEFLLNRATPGES